MGILCVNCGSTVQNLDQFRRHISQRDHNSPYYCSQGECNKRKFLHPHTLIRHLRENHDNETDSSEDSGSEISSDDHDHGSDELNDSPDRGDSVFLGEAIPEDLPSNEDACSHSESRPSIEGIDFEREVERAAAFLVLNLLKRGNVPGSAITVVCEETQALITQVVELTKKKISSHLIAHGIEQEIVCQAVDPVSAQEPFKRLKSKEQQLKYFEEHFNLVRPESKFIGYRYDQRLASGSGNIEPKQIPVHFQYISVIRTLTAVLNIPVLFDLIQQESASTDGMLRSYLDGSIVHSNNLITDYPNTLRIVLYSDDFECSNPLGSKASIHKITGVYYYIQNLPPVENSHLRSIHVAAYACREDLPRDRGIDILLEPFFQELQQLESEEGVKVIVQGEEYTLRATLITGTGDALAADEMLGLLPPSAKRFCSLCLVTRDDLHKNIFAMGERRTHELHLEHIEQIRSQGEVAKKYLGVERDCLLIRQPKYAKFPEAFMKDCLHDVLRGIGPMELKLTLRQFCIVRKYFDVEFLNSRLQAFNYGLPDVKNKPSPNFTHAILSNMSYTLHQTAAQTWCFINVFPFLFGQCVPEDDPYMKLMVLLKRICSILFSAAVSESDIQLLESLLYEHHSLFFELHPPPDENEDEGRDENRDEDFLEEVQEPEAQETSTAPSTSRVPKRKVVRPVNKHHHLLHAPSEIRKYGPMVLYWCMRLEAKHLIAKRFASICCNFQNLPLTLADIHQIHHAAELLNIKCSVRDSISLPQGSVSCVDETEHSDVLQSEGLGASDIIFKLTAATISGFEYRAGMFVTLPLVLDGLPLFGRIICLYRKEQNVYFVTEDYTTINYDLAFGAYHIDRSLIGTIRASRVSRLLAHRPMVSWSPYESSDLYLSPRCAIAESLLVTDAH